MSSHSRNSRKPIRTLLAVAAVALAGSAAYADETGHFELTAFSNGTGGAALTSGDYNAALGQLQHGYFLQNNDTVSTNRCVAYTVTRRLDEARVACDAAVRDAQLQLTSMPVSMSWARSDYRDYLAVAYSNRAVLDWMLNDTKAAQSDLKKAAAVSPKAAFVARNETALESHAKFARVSAR
jgi:hypothetical protein